MRPGPDRPSSNNFWYLSPSGSYNPQESFVYFEFLPVEQLTDLSALLQFLQVQYPCYPWQRSSANTLGTIAIAAGLDTYLTWHVQHQINSQRDVFGVRYFMMRAGYLFALGTKNTNHPTMLKLSSDM